MQQIPFEASPFSYAAQDWASPGSAQNQQNWNEQPAWNTPQQASWSMSPQTEQPAWGTPQQDQQSWGAPPQQEQQWGWSMAPEGQQRWNNQQPEQQSPSWNDQQSAQQQWNAAQSGLPEQASPTAQPGQGNVQMGLVPYQGGMELQPARSRTSMLQILPADLAEKMLPAIPQEEMAVYVPPIYTKPRAIIPRYRAISGLLSIVIVALMLCTGAGYAAKASGTLDTLTRVITGETHIAALPPQTTSVLPVPKTLRETGPAYGTIYSATTTSRVDAATGLPIQEEHAFKVNQIIHVTYAVQSTKPGTLQLQWFSNGNPVTDPSNYPFDPKGGQNKHADATFRYEAPAEGSVELKWNNQLAVRLYFVVQAA
jgi:hypothetical protein